MGMTKSKSDETAPEAGTHEPASELETLRSQLAEAENRAAESWDKALRATAELENVRRRVERDAVNLRKYALENILGELLAVGDSLEMGLKAVASESAETRAHLEGLQLTHKQFWAVLERNGVTAIDPIGQPFNPDLHQAVSMQESTDTPANQVISVMQKGYRLHDRLLRPAMVVVAKAPITGDSG